MASKPVQKRPISGFLMLHGQPPASVSTHSDPQTGNDHMKPNQILPLAAAVIALPGLALAQDAEYATLADTTFIFNTLLFLIGGFLVFWMAAGFAMLEAGLVRSKNVTTQLTKNMGLFAIAAVMYWLVGYNIMYPGDGNWIMEGVLAPSLPKTSRPRLTQAAIPTLPTSSFS